MRALTVPLALLLAASASASPDPFPREGRAWTDPPADQAGELRLDAELFTGWRSTWQPHTAADEAFALERAQLGAVWAGPEMGAEVRLQWQAPRSPLTPPATAVSGLGGLGGLSVPSPSGPDLRHAHAWMTARWAWTRWTLDVGRIPTPWTATIEGELHLRGAGPLQSESADLVPTDELGAALVAEAWRGRARLSLSAANSANPAESYTGRALSAVLSLSPLASAGHRLTMHGLLRRDRRGPAELTVERLGGALTLDHRDYGAGAVLLFSGGFAGDPDRDARGLDLWCDARLLVPWLGVLGRLQRLDVDGRPDSAEGAASLTTVSAGLFADLHRLGRGLPHLRAYLVYEDARPDQRDEARALGLEAQRLWLRLEARALRRL